MSEIISGKRLLFAISTHLHDVHFNGIIFHGGDFVHSIVLFFLFITPMYFSNEKLMNLPSI